VKGSDFGFWRRVHLVPFEANITNPDLHLTDKLLEELPGILNWCLEGWQQCKQGHFVIPQTIKKHSEDYRGEMDLVQQWKDDCLQILVGAQIKAMDGYQSFKAWQIDNGHHPMTANSFYRKVKSHLGTAQKKSDGNYYLGYRIKP
jgi:putative DNA primase/helicase